MRPVVGRVFVILYNNNNIIDNILHSTFLLGGGEWRLKRERLREVYL
jgi:hypothetical protein